MKSELRAFTSQKIPNFLQNFDIRNNSSIIHVPLIVHWVQLLNFVYE